MLYSQHFGSGESYISKLQASLIYYTNFRTTLLTNQVPKQPGLQNKFQENQGYTKNPYLEEGRNILKVYYSDKNGVFGELSILMSKTH